VAVVGGGPAGLMAAEVISRAGEEVEVYDAMPSVGRKLLLAGKGGLNLTHSEAAAAFRRRYGGREPELTPLLKAFGPPELREWAHGLGIETFVGSSGRVFPTDMKAAPLLRAWLQRLRRGGVRFHNRHRWCGWASGEEYGHQLCYDTPEGRAERGADAVVLALGGGSWSRLGSDGRWFGLLEAAEVALAPLRPANCGFEVRWSEHFRERFAGHPVKSVVAAMVDLAGVEHRRRGEFMLTANGLEGGLIYSLSAALRDTIEACGSATLYLDLLPDHDAGRVIGELARPRGTRSLSSHLQSRLQLKGAKVGLLRECFAREGFASPEQLGAAIKSLPISLVAPRPLDEAISTAGGVRFEGLDDQLMLRNLPGVFCAGEMLDWEAPTGGYLLTACLASGYAAGGGVLRWLKSTRPDSKAHPQHSESEE
jgi:uncharacterized flavoprotein (TIGR03862 family)